MVALTALMLLGACASVDAHRASGVQEGKASLRVVVDPAPGELYSLVLSGDGRVVVGTILGVLGPRAFIWTDADGRQALPAPQGGHFVRINGISRDGAKVVGDGRLRGNRQPEENALLWQSGKGTTALGHLQANPDIDQTKGLAISADGTVVVGSSLTPGSKMRPFLWTEADGMRDLDADLRDHSEPVALSGDGTVVTGRLMDPSAKMHRAFRWSAEGGVQLLGEVRDEARSGNVHSWPMAISRDGRAIVGNHGTAGREGRGAQHAFRWTAEEGLVDLGVLPGVDHSIATAVNADGSVIVGSSGSSVEAFIWDPAHGMHSLQEVLQAWGVDTKGWRLTRAAGISDDGTRILCYGYAPVGDDVNEAALLATLPPEAFKQAP